MRRGPTRAIQPARSPSPRPGGQDRERPGDYGVYAASKAAIRSFARTWTAELGPRRIRVNVVSPGPTDTAMMAATTQEMRAAMVSQIPLGRMTRPDEVAAATAFLLREDASFINGAELCVDGGMAQV